ncbi:MAG: glycosyltransferase, partial [Flavobacteriales bacterium]
ANITAVGPFDVNDYALKEISKYIHLTGPLSRSHVQEYYMNADVFVLPSLCEGSATVIYEAMSFGLPIITTNNSGSIIENGNEGFI